MKVYYSKGWAITFIISGSVLLALNFWLFQLTGKLELYRALPGIGVIVVGILYLFQPYFEVTDTGILTYSLLGYVAWRYSVEKLSDFVFEGNKLYRNKNGRIKRIRISRFVCNKKQWEEFVNYIGKHEPGSELHE